MVFHNGYAEESGWSIGATLRACLGRVDASRTQFAAVQLAKSHRSYAIGRKRRISASGCTVFGHKSYGGESFRSFLSAEYASAQPHAQFLATSAKGRGLPSELMVANREVAHADAQYGDRRRNPIPLVSLKPSSWIGRAGSRLIRLGRSLPVEPDRLESALVSRDRGGMDRR